MRTEKEFAHNTIISEICEFDWSSLSDEGAINVIWAYYFFSIQFRENLEIALEIYPNDDNLRALEREECDTDNLSPWPCVADVGEKLNHDEFVRRLLSLRLIPERAVQRYYNDGNCYLDFVRGIDPEIRALSIASYEDGGLERVFRAMLNLPASDDPMLAGFRHFLSEHIKFDSDPDQGHGALARHLQPDDRVLPLWVGFKQLLMAFAPGLASSAVHQTSGRRLDFNEIANRPMG